MATQSSAKILQRCRRKPELRVSELPYGDEHRSEFIMVEACRVFARQGEPKVRIFFEARVVLSG